MFNGYVLYLQAVTTPNPFVKLPKLPFHKSLLLIFCLRLRFPFSFFKLFFAAAALVIFPGRLWLFPTALVIFQGWPVFPAALVIFPGWLRLFSRGGLFFRRLWLFPTALVFSRAGSVFPAALVIFPGWLWLFSRRGNSNYTVLDIFLPL